MMNKQGFFYNLTVYLILMAFVMTTIASPVAFAQSIFGLPLPGTMISPSAGFTPTTMLGMTIYPENPLKFDFIIDGGDDHLDGEALQSETKKLINYFLATLTVPEDEMWVNLSPYEKDRIIADGLSVTEMGRDMLAQDYLLKQLTASLMYPEEKTGSAFWKRVEKKVRAEFGFVDIPTDTFNKVWIVPDKAVVYVSGNSVFVSECHLKVMLEQDYFKADTRHQTQDTGENSGSGVRCPVSGVSEAGEQIKEIIREIILPEIEKEVNEGKNFAPLRQIFNSVILASWYKKNLKQSILGKVYVDQNKVNGIDLEDRQVKEKIYNQYVEAFKVGVYDYIKEEYDPAAQAVIPRHYFSGGVVAQADVVESDKSGDLAKKFADQGPEFTASVNLGNVNGEPIVSETDGREVDPLDSAMLVDQRLKEMGLGVNAKGQLRRSGERRPLHFAAKEIVGTRHGRTRANRYRILNGQANDLFLDSIDEQGEAEAKALADNLIRKYEKEIKAGNVVVITSEMVRTQQTAQPFLARVKKDFGVEIQSIIDADLNEMNVGDGTHKAYAMPPAEFHAEMRKLGIEPVPMSGAINEIRKQIWPDDGSSGSAVLGLPNGESYADLVKRQRRFAQKIATKYAGKTVILFGHAIQMSALRLAVNSNVIEAPEGSNEKPIIQWRKMELNNGEITTLYDSQSDPAMLGQVQKKNPGGIDFNPNAMNLEERGQAVDFAIDNAMLGTIDPDSVLGITPVIINIIPITNYLPLLGLSEGPKPGVAQLSMR